MPTKPQSLKRTTVNALTPKIPLKLANQKPSPAKVRFQPVEKLNLDQDDAAGDAKGFVESIWPLLEAKLEHWLLNSELIKSMETAAIKAVDAYVSSDAFKHSVSESLNFDYNELTENHKLLKTLVNETQLNIPVINAKCDDLEQYSRRDNIRISGIDEKPSEDTNKIVIETLKEQLNIDCTVNEISRSHRVGKVVSGKPRQIIVKFVRHDTKASVMRKRKLLKEKKSNIFVNEDLTKGRMEVIKSLINKKEIIQKFWTVDGTIHVRTIKNPTNVISMRSLCDLDNLMSQINK